MVLIAHNELLHDSEEVEGEDGKKLDLCTLYPGMTCRDHINAAVDIDSGRGEGLIQVPFIELCPNSWLVDRTGEVTRIEEKVQFQPKAVREQVEALQKKLGPPMTSRAWQEMRPRLERALALQDEEEWREALETYAAVAKAAPGESPGLSALLKGNLEAMNESVELDAEYFLELDAVDEDDREQARELFGRVDVSVAGRYLPVRDALKDWLGKQAAGAK